MLRVLNILCITLLLGFVSNNELMDYPKSKKDNVNEVIFGQNIEDPYRWLEDFTEENVTSWVEEQNNFTDKFLENEFQKKIKKDLKEIFIPIMI